VTVPTVEGKEALTELALNLHYRETAEPATGRSACKVAVARKGEMKIGFEGFPGKAGKERSNSASGRQVWTTSLCLTTSIGTC